MNKKNLQNAFSHAAGLFSTWKKQLDYNPADRQALYMAGFYAGAADLAARMIKYHYKDESAKAAAACMLDALALFDEKEAARAEIVQLEKDRAAWREKDRAAIWGTLEQREAAAVLRRINERIAYLTALYMF